MGMAINMVEYGLWYPYDTCLEKIFLVTCVLLDRKKLVLFQGSRLI